MSKIMNAVFGIGIAVIVFIVALLGIRAFYPEPTYEKYCNTSIYSQPYPAFSIYDCPRNVSVEECINIMNTKGVDAKTTEEMQAQETQMRVCSEQYDKASKSYNKIFFIIASILGLIAIIVAYLLLDIMSLSAGVAFAGIVLIIVAFARGWNDSNDILKFVIGLLIALVVIFLAIKINSRFSDKKKK
ncbi:MAG: hypothetical protein ACP5N3_02630 [Candidatus Nanoarchaeia archaeon]